jgi:hypothetical protein
VRPAGRWSVSPRLPHDVHLAGTPRLTLDVGLSGQRGNVFASVYDIAPDQRAQLLTRGAHAVRRSGTISYDLYPQDWTFKAGHRIGVAMLPSDEEWFLPLPSLGTVTRRSGSLALPFLRYTRSSFLPGRKTKVEQNRPPGLDVAAAIVGAETAFDLPPALVDPPSAALPVAGKPPRLTVTLRRVDRRRIRVSGRGPAGLKLRVRVTESGRKLVVRRVTIGKRATWTWTTRVARRRGRVLRVVVTAPAAGTTVRVTSRHIR